MSFYDLDDKSKLLRVEQLVAKDKDGAKQVEKVSEHSPGPVAGDGGVAHRAHHGGAGIALGLHLLDPATAHRDGLVKKISDVVTVPLPRKSSTWSLSFRSRISRRISAIL